MTRGFLQSTKSSQQTARLYGPDGKPLRDVDTGHPEHHPDIGSPHGHEWEDGKRGSAHPLPPDPEPSQGIDWGAVGTFALGFALVLGGGAYFVLSGDPSIVQNAILSFP